VAAIQRTSASRVSSRDPRSGDFAWAAAFTALVVETGGVGGRVYAVQAVLMEAGKGPGGVTDRQISRVDVDLTSARLPSQGCLGVPILVRYALPGGEREALVDVAAIVIGDDGYYYQTTRRFRIA
jgi:hypothetical protein